MESEEKIKELVKRVLDLPIEDRLKVIDIVMQATKAEQDDFELTEEQKARNTNEDPPIEGFSGADRSSAILRRSGPTKTGIRIGINSSEFWPKPRSSVYALTLRPILR